MKRLVALAAVCVAFVATVGLAGCQSRTGRSPSSSDQVGAVQTTPPPPPPAKSSPAGIDSAQLDQELASVDAQLSDVDSDLSAVDKTPEDAD
jgi:hypothetical protein